MLNYKKQHLKWIYEGRKWTILMKLTYKEYPFKREKIFIDETGVYDSLLYCLTDTVVKSEGYETFDKFITILKKMRYKLPQEFWLYDLRKPIESEGE